MTAVINIWTTDGDSRTLRQTDLQEIQFILGCVRQPSRMFENALIMSTPLCTSLIPGNMIARVELISYDLGIRKLLTDCTVVLMSLEPGADIHLVKHDGTSESGVRIDFRFLGGITFSALIERKAQTDIFQQLVETIDAGGLYYKIGEAGLGLMNTKAITGIEVHARQLTVPEDAWHAEDIRC